MRGITKSGNSWQVRLCLFGTLRTIRGRIQSENQASRFYVYARRHFARYMGRQLPADFPPANADPLFKRWVLQAEDRFKRELNVEQLPEWKMRPRNVPPLTLAQLDKRLDELEERINNLTGRIDQAGAAEPESPGIIAPDEPTPELETPGPSEIPPSACASAEPAAEAENIEPASGVMPFDLD